MGRSADERLTGYSKGAKAKAHGYLGEACPECGNYTLLSNGGELFRCDTCGSYAKEHTNGEIVEHKTLQPQPE